MGILDFFSNLFSPRIRRVGEPAADAASNRLYVGNLSYNTTEDDLRGLFTRCGRLTSLHMIRDRVTKKLKGYAFIEMSTVEEASKALSLNGTDFLGRKLLVSEAKSKGPGKRRRRFKSFRRPANGTKFFKDKPNLPRDE